jgi:hypothetical protein
MASTGLRCALARRSRSSDDREGGTVRRLGGIHGRGCETIWSSWSVPSERRTRNVAATVWRSGVARPETKRHAVARRGRRDRRGPFAHEPCARARRERRCAPAPAERSPPSRLSNGTHTRSFRPTVIESSRWFHIRRRAIDLDLCQCIHLRFRWDVPSRITPPSTGGLLGRYVGNAPFTWYSPPCS